MKKILCCLMLIGCCSHVCADNALRYDYDTKIVDGTSFSLPQTASLMQVLQVLPELLQRPNDNIFENYVVKIEGLSVGGSKDAILSQVMLMDIDKIEVEDSPASNYENNGQGGEINIVLKPLKEGTSGNAFAMLGYPGDYIPGLSLNKKSSRWTVRSFLTGEVFSQEDIKTNYNIATAAQGGIGTLLGSNRETTTEDNKLHQMLKLYANFQASDKDVLKFSLSEMADKTVNKETLHLIPSVTYTETDKTQRNLEMMFKTEYGHTFNPNAKSNIELLYTYDPQHDKIMQTSQSNLFSKSDDKNHSVSGKVEYEQTLSWRSSQSVKLIPGCKFNYAYNHTDANMVYDEEYPNRCTTANNFFVSPYFQLKGTFGNWHIKGNAECQIYHYKLKASDPTQANQAETLKYNETDKRFVFDFATVWDINQHHALRLMGKHTLNRPTESQMFPHVLYSIANTRYEYGNAYLKPMITNSLTLEYLFNHDTGKNKWLLSLGAKYIHTSDEIKEIIEYVPGMKSDIAIWDNGDEDNIFNINAMLRWKRGWFSTTATGSFFSRHTIKTAESHRYCSLALMPEAQLGDGWNICLSARYNTKVIRNNINLPALTILGMYVSKNWSKRFTTFASGNVSLNHRINQRTILSNGDIETMNYVQYSDNVYVGVRYNF